MPKLGSDGKIHISIVKRKRPDGSRYVQGSEASTTPRRKTARSSALRPKESFRLGKLISASSFPATGKEVRRKRPRWPGKFLSSQTPVRDRLFNILSILFCWLSSWPGLAASYPAGRLLSTGNCIVQYLRHGLPISLIRIFLTIRSAMSSESLAKVTSTSSLSSTRSLCRSSTRRGLLPWTVRPYAQHQAWSTRLTAAIC